jgi:hypothetical protein
MAAQAVGQMPAFAGAEEEASMPFGMDFAAACAGALAGECVVECALVAKVPTVGEGPAPARIAFAGELADCWYSGLDMETGLVGRNLQQTGEFEVELPGSEQVAVG